MNYFTYLLIALLLSILPGGVRAEFVFAHINESIMPVERGSKYEDPLDAYLREKGIGEVTGGGSSLTTAGGIEWVGVDIELAAPPKNIQLVARKLKLLGAPRGSFLEYSVGEQKYTVPIK